MTLSIGTILKRAREKRRLTQDDVSKYIKIPNKYLRALESDDYTLFSDKVHAKGFLRIYSEFLNLNSEELLALWRREYDKYFDNKKITTVAPQKPIEYPKVYITPSLVFVFVVCTAVVGFFGYLFYQYRNYTGAPNMVIYNPKENTVVDKDILDITGVTDLDSEVYVNNQKIVLNTDGSFAESLKLKEGLNTISIKAINKLDKQTEFVKTIIYRPAEKPEMPLLQTTESTNSPKAGDSAPTVGITAPKDL